MGNSVRSRDHLSDAYLQIVMRAACVLPIEKRDLYLQRIAAMLALRGCGHFDDADVTDGVARAHQAARVRVCG